MHVHAIQEPQHRISSHAVKVLRLNALIEMFISFVILSVLLFLYYHYNWFRWIGLIIYILAILAVVRTVYEIFINPVYTQRTWRYEIDEKHVQLKHGAFKKTYQIIPMAKVQYVETIKVRCCAGMGFQKLLLEPWLPYTRSLLFLKRKQRH